MLEEIAKEKSIARNLAQIRQILSDGKCDHPDKDRVYYFGDDNSVLDYCRRCMKVIGIV